MIRQPLPFFQPLFFALALSASLAAVAGPHIQYLTDGGGGNSVPEPSPSSQPSTQPAPSSQPTTMSREAALRFLGRIQGSYALRAGSALECKTSTQISFNEKSGALELKDVTEIRNIRPLVTQEQIDGQSMKTQRYEATLNGAELKARNVLVPPQMVRARGIQRDLSTGEPTVTVIDLSFKTDPQGKLSGEFTYVSQDFKGLDGDLQKGAQPTRETRCEYERIF